MWKELRILQLRLLAVDTGIRTVDSHALFDFLSGIHMMPFTMEVIQLLLWTIALHPRSTVGRVLNAIVRVCYDLAIN